MDRLKQYHSEEYHSEIISDISMLPAEEQELLKKALNKSWTNPKFKLKWFVGEMQITPFAKMRQWLLELRSKEEVIDFQEYEIKKLEIKIKKAKRHAEKIEDILDKEEAQVELDKLNFDLKLNKRRLQDGYLERQNLIDLVKEFLDSPEGKTPDGRSLIEVLNTQEEEIYEAEYWTARLAKQAAMDICAYGRIGVGNMDALCQLSQQQQTDALALAHRYALQLDSHQAVIRKEMAKQLGLPENWVPIIGLEQTSSTIVKEDAHIKISDTQTTTEELESVYRI